MMSRCCLSLLFVAGAYSARFTRFTRDKRVNATPQGSVLSPVSVLPPDATLFPESNNGYTGPSFTNLKEPLQTNKFWGNWLIGQDGGPSFSIFPAPYQLRWGDKKKLMISHRPRDFQGADLIIAHFTEMLSLSTVEDLGGIHEMIKQDHFGAHFRVGQGSKHVTYPIYAGMAYVTAQYSGGVTPYVTSNLQSVSKVKNGIWAFKNVMGDNFRVYALTDSGVLVDGSYNFSPAGVLNQQLSGWVRVAHVVNAGDEIGLDAHAESVLTGWKFDVLAGEVQYKFETVDANKVNLLHYAYSNHLLMLKSSAGNAHIETSMKKFEAPIKGWMTPIVGNTWYLTADLTAALDLNLLPANEPDSKYTEAIKEELSFYLEFFADPVNWRENLFKRDHYFSGKGYQKLGYVCLLSARYFGLEDARTQRCASTLADAFKCMYSRSPGEPAYWTPGIHNPPYEAWAAGACTWAPPGTIYDKQWGGIPTRWHNGGICGVDFGNSCYNDHHYHYGYFVVAGAILLELKPEYKQNTKFVDFINMFIRDTSNPSLDDKFFPQFRAFDWFDMHSWSRGLKPNPMGKDQESTSEEVNLHFGTMLWGRALGNDAMMTLGATMLTVASVALKEFFLMKYGNSNYIELFNKNHVTGIYFQGKVHLTTWFGPNRKYIQGIQMLPLTPAVPLSRDQEYAVQEWNDQVGRIVQTEDSTDKWKSLLVTGNLAFHQPTMAMELLTGTKHEHFDDGLTKVWALYWTATACTTGCDLEMTTTPAPTPAPTPPPAAGPAPPSGGCGVITCKSDPSYGQMCPGYGGGPAFACPQCGRESCDCTPGCDGEPTEAPPPAPPAPSPPQGNCGVVMCNPDPAYGQMCPGTNGGPAFACPQCGRGACDCFCD